MRRRDFLGTLGSVVAATAVTGGLAGCGSSAGDPGGRPGVVRYQGWTGKVVWPELAADLGLLDGLALEWIGNTNSGPQDIQATVTGDTDTGCAFNGAVLELAAAGAPITSVFGYYGTDSSTYVGYYVPEASPLREPRDLVGRTVAVNTLGGHYEAVLRLVLARQGLTRAEIDSVQMVVVPPASAEQSLRSGQVDAVALNDVWRLQALARGGLRAVFTDYDALGAFTAGTYVMRDAFLAGRPQEARAFVTGSARALAWAQQHPVAEVVDRFRDIVRRRGRAEDPATVGYYTGSGVRNLGGVVDPAEFSLWWDWLSRDGRLDPTKVDPAHVATNALNPYAVAPPVAAALPPTG